MKDYLINWDYGVTWCNTFVKSSYEVGSRFYYTIVPIDDLI